MNYRCDDGHPPILHGEFYCPLCTELEDHQETADKLTKAEGDLEEVKAADVLAMKGDLEETQREVYAYRTALEALRHAVLYQRTSPMGKYITRVQAIARRGEGGQ